MKIVTTSITDSKPTVVGAETPTLLRGTILGIVVWIVRKIECGGHCRHHGTKRCLQPGDDVPDFVRVL